MRSFVCAMAATLVLGGVAEAQTPAAAAEDQGYAEFVLQSAFGNVTSQNYGIELGYTVYPQLQIFLEGGITRDVATKSLGAAAQTIAGALSAVQPGATYSVKEPVTFAAVGVRYLVPMANSKLQPYVLGGIGLAKVKQDVKFNVGGTDVTNNMQQFGIVLGTDLTGDFNKAMMVLGGGVTYPVWQRLVLDLQYRYGRIFAESEAITVSRAGIGVGVKF